MKILLILLILSTLWHSAQANVTPLSYQDKNNQDLAAPSLNNDEWRWLGEKREVRLALYGEARPPITRISPTGMLTGYFPDIVFHLIRSLGLTLQIARYDTAHEALEALNSGRADMVFRPAGDDYGTASTNITAINILHAHPVLVEKKSDMVSDDVNLSLSSHVNAATNSMDLLAELDMGKIKQVILPVGEAYYLIERNYATTLSIIKPVDTEMSGYDMLFNNNRDGILINVFSKALTGLRNNINGKLLAAKWDQDDMVQYISKPIDFSDREKLWIEKNKKVRYAASALNAPFVLKDKYGEMRGIGPDILHLIQLKTGIHFSPVSEDNIQDLSRRMIKENLLMTAPLIWSDYRSTSLLLTTPFMYSPEVLVTRNRMDQDNNSLSINTIALIHDQDITKWFINRYPHIQVKYAPDSSLAMQWVAEGKVDASINTLFSARYLVSGLYPDQLIIDDILPFRDVAISFGVRRDSPELQSILDKTIAALPPAMISRIVSRWQGTPAARFDAWNLYKTEIYSGAGIALLLIVITAAWALILSRQVKRTRLAQSRLREEILFRDKLINGPPRPIYVVNNNGEIIRSNEAFDLFFRTDNPETLHLSLYDRRNPLFTIWKKCLQQLEEKVENEERDFIIQIDGRERTLRHWITPYINENGERAGVICGWQDITGYLALLDELSKSKEIAELANKSKSHFLATMSHEIRTPISAVIGLLELQNRQGSADPELIRAAHQSSKTLLALIGDILDMSKIESGHMELHPEWITPDALLMPVIRITEGLARQKGLSFSWSLPNDKCEIYIDAVRLRQIVTNFSGNAVKFTSKGSVVLSVELKKIFDGKAELNISVQDAGCGIAKEDMTTIFEPFVQSGANSHHGTGLGLAISRDMVHLMKGHVSLESEVGKGTTVYTAIQVQRREVLTADSAFNEIPINDDMHSLQILIVDDHPANRLLLNRQLTLLGHHVKEASNGSEGINVWLNGHIDIIFTDCSMPEIDGLEMTQIIRQKGGGIPVIGMTANAQLSERTRCLDAGMNMCLFRPVTTEQIATSIAQIFHETSFAESFSDLVDIESLNKFIPSAPEALNDFMTSTFIETRNDLAQSKKALVEEDYHQLTRLLHRMAGTLSVIGFVSLSDKIEFIEELISLEEDSESLMLHLTYAEVLLEKIIKTYKAYYSIEGI